MTKEDFHLFFQQRIVDLYNKLTLDSYRVRSNNSLSLLIELKNVIESWSKGNIKKSKTVEVCIEETINSLEKKDSKNNNLCCLDFSSCVLLYLIEDLNNYKKKLQQEEKEEKRSLSSASHMTFYLSKIIQANENKYLNILFDKLYDILFQKEERQYEEFELLMNFNYYVSEFSCELIRIGYSKVDLFIYFRDILKKRCDLQNEFNNIKDKFLIKEKNSYISVFKIGFGKINVGTYNDFCDEVPKNLLDKVIDDKIKKSLKKGSHYKFFIDEEYALDSIGAIKKSRVKLLNILDSQYKGDITLNVTSRAVSFLNSSEIEYLGNFYAYSLDNTLSLKKEYDIDLYSNLQKIKENKRIDSNIYTRIASAIRHLRIGDYQEEIEQTFINYWIGLEFLFSSPSSKQSTFMRLVECFVTISKCCYVKRNLEYLRAKLLYHNVIDESDSISWQDSSYMDDIISKIPDHLVCLKYQVMMMKSHCHSKDSLKNYVNTHAKNVTFHLHRIYRLRNELIHEAAIKQDIESITSDLRYYLVFIMNQSISYFANREETECKIEVDDFYWEFESKFKMIQYSKFDMDTLNNISVESGLVV